MSSARDPFINTPLDDQSNEIRLLTVSPDLVDGLINVALSHHTRNDSLRYMCLSYVWGPKDNGHTILVNGRRFLIRQNLHDFLHRARSLLEPDEFIWIDAVSINQNDIPEKNVQVQRMADIYSGAHTTYI